MKTFIALFRGINVGGRNILPMKALADTFCGLGLSPIQTYIQSGNVIFQADTDHANDLARTIGTAGMNNHKLAPKVLVLSLEEFRAAIASNPFPEGEDDPKSLHLFFLESLPTNPDLKKLQSLQLATEQFKLTGKTFYLHTPGGIGRSKLAANVEKALGVAVTARNWRSVNAILSLVS